MVYKTMKIYITKYSEIIKPVLVHVREGALWAHRVGGDTGAGSSRQMDYVTTCGLVPSSVRSYLGVHRERRTDLRSAGDSAVKETHRAHLRWDTHHWVQPLASSSDARPTNTCGQNDTSHSGRSSPCAHAPKSSQPPPASARNSTLCYLEAFPVVFWALGPLWMIRRVTSKSPTLYPAVSKFC